MSCDQTLIIDLRDYVVLLWAKMKWLTDKFPNEILLPEPEGVYVFNKLYPVIKPADQVFNKKTNEPITTITRDLKCDVVDETGLLLIPSYMLATDNQVSDKPFVSVRSIEILRIMLDLYIQSKLLYGRRNVELADYKDQLAKHIRPEFLDLLIVQGGLYSCARSLEIMIESFMPNNTWELVYVSNIQTISTIAKTGDYRIKDWEEKVKSGVINDSVAKRMYMPEITGHKVFSLGEVGVLTIDNYSVDKEADYKLKSSTGKSTRNGKHITLDTMKIGTHYISVGGTRYEYIVSGPHVIPID